VGVGVGVDVGVGVGVGVGVDVDVGVGVGVGVGVDVGVGVGVGVDVGVGVGVGAWVCGWVWRAAVHFYVVAQGKARIGRGMGGAATTSEHEFCSLRAGSKKASHRPG